MGKKSKKDARKRKKRAERIRQEKHQRRTQSQTDHGSWLGADDGWDPEPRPFDQERYLRAQALQRGNWLVDSDDRREAMQAVNLVDEDTAGPGESAEAPASERAQELAYQAMESEDPDEAMSLTDEALALDPACGDARRLHIENTSTGADRRRRLTSLMDDLKLGLDPNAMSAAEGHLSRLLTARPWLRALHARVASAADDAADDDLLTCFGLLMHHDHTSAWTMFARICENSPKQQWTCARLLRPLLPSQECGGLTVEGLLALHDGQRRTASETLRQVFLVNPALRRFLARPDEDMLSVEMSDQQMQSFVIANALIPLVTDCGFVAWYENGMPWLEDADVPQALAAYQGPVAALIGLGEAKYREITQHDYRALGISPQHRRELEQVIESPIFTQIPTNHPATFAPIHAWRALAQVGGPESLPAMLHALADENDDYALDEIPLVISQLGTVMLEPVLAAHAASYANADEQDYIAMALQHSLALLTTADAGAHQAVVTRLCWAVDDRQCDRETVRADAIFRLSKLGVSEALPAIERAYADNCVDEAFITLDNARKRLRVAAKG